MSASSFIIGDDHPFRFPKIKGFLSPDKLDETIQQLKENKVWNLSEKVDGCNVTISSEGWFASRNKIIADFRDPNLTGRVWNNASLRNVPLVFEQALKLKSVLKSAMKQDGIEVALYCELILPGTSTTPYDVYNYKARHIKQGSLYAFALGMLVPKDVHLPFMFDHALYMENLSNDCNDYYIVPMNMYLSQLLNDLDIVHIPPHSVHHLASLLIDTHHMDILMHRKKEGFVLTSNDGQGFIKWKYNKAEELRPDLTEAANKLIEHTDPGSWGRRAATKINMVYESGLRFANDISIPDTCKFFDSHMAEHNDRWKSTFEKAAKLGYYYLKLAMQRLEEEVILALWMAYGKERKSQIDPKLELQYKQHYAHCIKTMCAPYIKQTRERIASHECECNIEHEEADEHSESSSSMTTTSDDSDEYS